MEVSQRYTIAYEGLGNGSHDFEFQVDGGLFREFESSEIKDGACEVRVRLERVESMLALDVAIEGGVVVACDRCLEDCRVPIDFEGSLLVKFSDQVQEYDGEVMWLLPGESEIDLTQYIYESIVLSLPYQRVHPDGECDPGMIERFQIITEQELATIEERASLEQGGGEWEKLAQLKAQLETEQKAAEKAPAKK